MKRLLLCLLLSGCATFPKTPEQAKEDIRNAIYWRHSQCIHTMDEEARTHGQNALGIFRCDQEATRDCLANGLEPQCAQWQWGGT